MAVQPQKSIAQSLAGLLLVAALTSVGVAQPTLRDAAFEQAPGAVWSARTSFGSSTPAWDPQVRHSGTGSLRVDLARFGGCTLSQRVACAGGGSFSFGCWVRTELEAADAVYTYVQWLDGAGAVLGLGAPSASAAGTADWRLLVAPGEAPAGAAAAVLKVVAGQGRSPRGGRVWLADSFLRPGSDVGGALGNTGFEKDSDGDGNPDGWRPFTAGEGFVLARDTAVAHSGQCSARLTGLPGHGDRSCYGQVSAPCTPPARVRLRYWYKGRGASTGFVRFRPAPGVTLPGGQEFYDTQSFSVPLPQADWSEFTFTATTPPAALAARLIAVEVTIYQRGEGDLWLDDLSTEGLEADGRGEK